jgi:phosphoenolpyruvate carboxykinase (ATP)
MSTAHAGPGLEVHGLHTSKPVHANLPPAVLYEHAIRRAEGIVAAEGPLVCRTGAHTGRSPNDKFVVREPTSEGHIWWGKVNKPMAPDRYAVLRSDVLAHLGARELFVQDLYAGADPEFRLPVRFVQEYAWHNLFVRNLFIVPPAADLAAFQPRFTVFTAPSFKADAARHGIHLHRAELRAAAVGRAGDALLGEPGSRGRRGAVLRVVRHGQDHAVERSRTAADRR